MFEIQKEKMEQTIKYLNDYDIDMWIIYTSEGSDPCLPLVTGVETVGPGAFLFTKEGKRLALCSSIDAQDIEESKLFDDVIHDNGNLAAAIAKVVERNNPKSIAVNISKEEHLADGLTTGRFRWLKKAIKDVFTGEYVSSEPFLTLLRSIKSKTEVSYIQEAVNITIEIYETVFKKMKVGMTEKDVGSLFIDEMNKRGVVNGVDRTVSMPIVMRENIAHRPPSDAIIQPGDLVIMDFSIDYKGYVSDIARTVYMLAENETTAPEPVQNGFDAVLQSINKAVKELKPGVKGYEVDNVARENYILNGYPEITHATGHQIGRDVHDGGVLLGPLWERYGEAPYGKVEPNMVFTIEPTLFLDDGIHFIVEENILVTETGINYLSKRQDELILINSSEVERV